MHRRTDNIYSIFRDKLLLLGEQVQHRLIHKCNGNCYICVIGEVEDYYGVNKIIACNVRPVSSGNKVTHHFLEVAYSFDKGLEYAEDEMLRAVPLK